MDRREDWLGQQLAEFLGAVGSYPDERSATAAAIERAAEALEAEFGAIIRRGEVVSAVGFARGKVPKAELQALGASRSSEVDLPGTGKCAVLTVPLGTAAGDVMVLARCEGAFTQQEASLLRGMARALTLSVDMLTTIEAERALRRESERQSEENARLLASVQERQTLLERLFTIQRAISRRAPIHEVFDAITAGAADLLGAEVAALRLIDPDLPSNSRLASAVGVDAATEELIRSLPLTRGITGESIREERLIVTEHYGSRPDTLPQLAASHLQAAMAAPVRQDGHVVGSLVVASNQPGRRYGMSAQEILLAFAEHASLALNDTSALDAMRKSIADAVHEAHHDGLTGLPNRVLIIDRLAHALAGGRRSDRGVAVLFIDLDRFKMVNDSLGHAIGDEVLVCVADRLSTAVRPGDSVGRLSGDEFVIVCEDVDVKDVLRLAERVLGALAQPLSLYGRDTVLTASIGIAMPQSDDRPEDILRNADVAMYRAKQRGRARIELFDQVLHTQILQRVETEQALRRALKHDQLRVFFQPIVTLADDRVTAVEALVRWEHPERGLVPPDEFITIAEEAGLIIPLGTWVLREACRQVAEWRRLPGLAQLRVGVNLSARQFADPQLHAIVAGAIMAAGIPSDALTLEITESVLMEEAQSTAETLQALKGLGVELSIDDFGTGYSSLSYLKRFPVDVLKIDRSFIRGVDTDADDHVIVNAVIGLAHALGLRVVAEGVERESQLAELRQLSCDEVQGYLLERPQPAERLFREETRASSDDSRGVHRRKVALHHLRDAGQEPRLGVAGRGAEGQALA